MRISSVHIYNIANKSMAQASEAMVKTQEQISTGRRVIDPSDDPVASTKILSLEKEMLTIEQYRKNIDIGKNNLTLEESALNSVNGIIIRMKELAVSAGNSAIFTEENYLSIATEVDSRMEELQNLLNTQNANGDFIFGGYKASEPPFQGNAQVGFKYIGDDGQMKIQAASNTQVSVTDSGKDIFVDIKSESNTIRTEVSDNNTSVPPISVTVGAVVDQEAYDKFYPEDIVIGFNADTNVAPPGKNFTAFERSTGRVIMANQPYTPGDDIEIHGTQIQILGSPVSGVAATPASQILGSDFTPVYPINFTPPNDETVDIAVNGVVETFTLDQNVTSVADMVNLLNNAGNGNAAKLANLGLTASGGAIVQADGINFEIKNASSVAVDNAFGLNVSAGSTSVDGQTATIGDQVYVNATSKQDILTTLARFSNALKDFDGSDETRVQLEDMVASTLDNLTHAQTSVLEITSMIGARFNTLDSTEQLHFDTELVSQELLSDLRDVDYAEATTRLSMQSFVLQAAQSSFLRVSQLSLFSQM